MHINPHWAVPTRRKDNVNYKIHFMRLGVSLCAKWMEKDTDKNLQSSNFAQCVRCARLLERARRNGVDWEAKGGLQLCTSASSGN